ncbi:hypothetical protein E3T46_07785 [Cryobacterium sp. Hh11]|uniref:hypothetical protein n=1 Tax=Cryobacterium sp. Hh11 TaxID=2555868 RepID=UPI00106D71E1|nr:hypothetical protein [Cryobacterium sp. Hh11]TFD51980.1 hypothetical protein E3T46_07785 [Cryobacterium sp. Hh11]
MSRNTELIAKTRGRIESIRGGDDGCDGWQGLADMAEPLADALEAMNPPEPTPKTAPDDSEANEMIATSEDLPEALAAIATKYEVPVTNNETRWQDGQFLRHVGDFMHDVKAAFERFPQSPTTAGEKSGEATQ